MIANNAMFAEYLGDEEFLPIENSQESKLLMMQLC